MYVCVCVCVRVYVCSSSEIQGTGTKIQGKNLPVQRKIEKSFVPGDFLRFRQKRDYKSRRTKFKYSVFWGSLNKLETVILEKRKGDFPGPIFLNHS